MELRKNISSSVPRFSKVFKASLACLILAALAWAGGEPWKAKPYQQWDASDVKRIFSDSPWSKVVQISASWKPTDSNAGAAPAEPQSSGGGARTGGMGGGAASNQASAPSQPSQTGGGYGATNAEASYAVRWISSRTIREAGYRSSVIEGRLKEDEAEKQLALPVDTYKVYVGGPDMTPFQSMDDKALQSAATLTEKKTKQHISATNAELVHSEDGKTLQGIVFSFPKQVGNGEPSISPNEKAVEFSCSAGKAKIQTTFDLSKMEDSKGRDI
jgi:hypothetical protein